MPAKEGSYSPVGRSSLSVDDSSSRSLLSQEEKHFTFERRRLSPAQRFRRLALKSLALFVILSVHAALVLLLARYIISTLPATTKPTSSSSSSSTPSMSHGGGGHGSHGGSSSNKANYATDMETHKTYTLEGVPPPTYKDVSAEFSLVNPCGESHEEARAKGCRFGVLYGAWLPQQCWDDETEDRFKSYDDWKFYGKPAGEEPLTWDEVARGDRDHYFVEWEYHQRHCAEMGRRFFTAVSRRGLKTIDSYLSQWAHTDHCAHSVMEVNPTHELMAVLQRKFPDCGLIRWKNE